MSFAKHIRVIVTIATVLGLMVPFVTTVSAENTDVVYVDIPDSMFGTFLPCDDGSLYMTGHNKIDLTYWFASIAPDGNVTWKITYYDERAIYKDILIIEGEPTLFVTKRSIPNRPFMANDPEMISYFLPVSASGTVKDPIMLPDWTQRANVFQCSEGVLLYGESYSGGADCLKVAMYNTAYDELWNLTVSGNEMPFDYCLGCLQTEDGFFFYGGNDQQQSAGIVKCSLDGVYQWSQTYPINASIQNLTVFNGSLTLMAIRWESDDDILFTLGEDGSILLEKTLISANFNIHLFQIIPFTHGCLVIGHKSYGEEKPFFLFIETLDSLYNVLDEIDMTDINVPMLQVKNAPNGQLYIAGMTGKDNNYEDWHIVYRAIDQTDAWFAKVK